MPHKVTGQISDLFIDITDALQGRTDVTNNQMAYYAARTIREITSKYPFEELRETGSNVILTPGTAIYPVSTFMNPGVTDLDDPNWLEALVIYVDFPTNTITTTLDYKTPKAIEVMIAPATKGLPSRWTRFGPNIHIGPTPNQAYTMFCRYQSKHPFSNPPSPADGLMIPLEWYDVIAYGTAERIAVIKRWSDHARYLHDILWGDPDFQSSGGLRGRPGLIAAHTTQPERDQIFNSRQLMPFVPRYNPR